MDLNEKFEINRKFRNLKDNLEHLIIFDEEKDEDINELYYKARDIRDSTSYTLNQIENEYAFFNSLHRQTKYDNIISLIKICERLDIDKSKIVINIANPNFDNVWSQINNMIEIPQDIIDFIDEYDRVFEEKRAEEKKKDILKRKRPDGSISFEEYIMNTEPSYGSFTEYFMDQDPYEIYLNDEELHTLVSEVFRNR